MTLQNGRWAMSMWRKDGWGVRRKVKVWSYCGLNWTETYELVDSVWSVAINGPCRRHTKKRPQLVMEEALWKYLGHVTMSTMCYPYGSGITCVCDGGKNHSYFTQFVVHSSKWLQHKLQAETYFDVFRTLVKRPKQPKGEEWLIGRQESIGGNRHHHIITLKHVSVK